jgi:REP element-mobilizing transposase RayT
LKFARDRRRWLEWLYEAKKRFGICVLNYTVTSNHIHLLVVDDAGRDVIPKSIQLIAGRTGQEYNQRKERKGAFWEDRYHTTAVERGGYLIQCLIYIDMNMVRAGVVNHPSEWLFSGYNEIQNPRQRYALIDYRRLMEMLKIKGINELRESRREWIENALKNHCNVREGKWTDSVAAGSKGFIEETKERLGFKVKGRRIKERKGTYELKETRSSYGNDFAGKISGLRAENVYFWDDFPYNSDS